MRQGRKPSFRHRRPREPDDYEYRAISSLHDPAAHDQLTSEGWELYEQATGDDGVTTFRYRRTRLKLRR